MQATVAPSSCYILFRGSENHWGDSKVIHNQYLLGVSSVSGVLFNPLSHFIFFIALATNICYISACWVYYLFTQ